jgi:lysozyme
MDMTPPGLAVVRSFEGRALKAYRDSVGVITIGYGNTNYDKFAVEFLGGPITMATTITEEQAEYLLIETMRRNYMPAVTKALGEQAPQVGDGGGSFHYNTGGIGRAGWVKLFLAHSSAEAITAAINSWNKAGGKVLAGLVRRRAREAAIILRGDYGPEGRTKPPTLNASGRIVSNPADPEHHLAGTPGMLKLGSTGPEVEDFKASMRLIGFTLAKTNVFDAETEAAVLSFQKSHPGLGVDGVVGPATRASVGREADLKRKLGNVAGAAAGTGGTGAAVEAAGYMHIPGGVWITLGVLAAIGIGWVAFRYRDEVIAMAQRIRS